MSVGGSPQFEVNSSDLGFMRVNGVPSQIPDW